LEIRSGGNAALTAETSDSYTIGGVFQPKFVPGLSLSVDYYNIKVNKVISSVAAQDILDQCYDQATLNNVFCSLFQRAGATGGPNGEDPFQIIEGSLLQSSLNFAKLQVRGIDAELNYRRDFGSIGRFSGRIQYTHVFQNDQFLNPADPNRADQLLLELGDPQDEASFSGDLKTGPFTMGYKLRYIGRQVVNSAEDVFAVQGRPPENADYASLRFYPSTFYHDVRLGIEVNNKFNFYLGADNVLDTVPPYGLSGIGGGSGIYDNRGRFLYAGIQAKF
jgi:outer membrane receptor protein involved in Fe transport